VGWECVRCGMEGCFDMYDIQLHGEAFLDVRLLN
jgi:hypothetical protein